ncbi:hypothetical protein Dsin_016380 [Dipteronia sinensis]|uniref:50S ribosomal protein L17, chloroplastic n=2 Tax=rosids TaxID=71275 RepID=A0AAE0AD44_9ROSI|nr:hypothetical protein Dsin_016380 [Dipteronia sinensis]
MSISLNEPKVAWKTSAKKVVVGATRRRKVVFSTDETSWKPREEEQRHEVWNCCNYRHSAGETENFKDLHVKDPTNTSHGKLNRPTGHRMSMLRTMVSQLVKHERIETTVAKAKEIRRLADNMVQLGKEGSLCAARRAAAFVRGDDVIHKLFTELAYRYKDRAGGYTRLLRTRIRVGDAAPMAYIEFVDRENELRQSKPPAPQPPQRAPLDPWTRSRLTRQYAPPKEEKSSDAEI